MLAADGGPGDDGTRGRPYGIRTSLDRSAFLVDLACKTAELAGLERRTDTHGVRPRPAGSLTGAHHPDRRGRRRDPHADRAGSGRRPARTSDLVLAGALRGSRGQRRPSAPVPGRRPTAPCSRAGTGPHGIRPAGGSAIAGVIDALPGLIGVYAGSAVSALRLKPGNWAGASACWGLENREAAVRFVAATAGQPARRERRTQAHRPQRQSPTWPRRRSSAARCGGSTDRLELPAEVPENPVAVGHPAATAADRTTSPRSMPWGMLRWPPPNC